MGATAIGTGINAPPGYARDGAPRAVARSRGSTLITAPDLVEATADTRRVRAAARACSSAAPSSSRRSATTCGCCSSGPRAGLGEINLPAMQPGSSIMPGKVNPVIPEVVNQVVLRRDRRRRDGDDRRRGGPAAAQRVRAGDRVSPAAQHRDADERAASCCASGASNGITANPARMRQFVEHSIGIVTALVPVIGYEKATSVAKEALRRAAACTTS